ncbi:unnamed protein product [Mytilus edulis]|uniref:Uncharacterized protein n=1 Tax=Mytilus edulis TaxID=6550 RepID=A0A8S3RQV9_MYTED|nr:unnamed protein product [Mytilus edulis]
MKYIEKDIAGTEQFIQSITKSGSTNQVNISFQMTKSLQKLSATVQKFGDIIVSYDPSDYSIQKRKDRQAQIRVATPTRNIDNMTLTFRKGIDTKSADVYGCSLLPDDSMIFSSYFENKLRVLKSEISKDFEIKKIDQPFDVVFIGDDSIAVTSDKLKRINIINLIDHKLIRSINVGSYVGGVVYKDGNLIYCARDQGIRVLNLKEKNTIVSYTEVHGSAYVTTFGDKLFYTNFNTHSVTCCDYHGEQQWIFCDFDCLRSPLGISVDNNGNVFVAGYDTHNVVVISPDGQSLQRTLII